MNNVPSLDVDWLRAFVAVADTKSFTAAGAGLAATQSTISVRIRKLEERLDRRLMERNPRSVVLTVAGVAFLEDARRILQIHDDAAMRALGLRGKRTFALAISDHAAGALLPRVLATLHRERPDLQLQVTLDASLNLFAAFDGGRYDAVIGRRDDAGPGDVLLEDKLVWTAAKRFNWTPPEPLAFVSLAAPCSIRDIALGALAAHGVVWRNAFTGTGVAAIQAAVSAGLGVACLETRNVPADCRRLQSGLPKLPRTQVVMNWRRRGPKEDAVAEAIAAAFRKIVAAGKIHTPR